MEFGKTDNIGLQVVGELYLLCQAGVSVDVKELDIDTCRLLVRIHRAVMEKIKDK